MGQWDHPISHPTSPYVFIFLLGYVLSCSVTTKLAESNSIGLVTSLIPSFSQRDWLEMAEVVELNHLPIVFILHNMHSHTGSRKSKFNHLTHTSSFSHLYFHFSQNVLLLVVF